MAAAHAATMRAAAPRWRESGVRITGGRLRGSRGRVLPILLDGRLAARAEGQEVAAPAPGAGSGRIAAEREPVECPAEAAPHLAQKGGVPVDGVDLSGAFGAQIAVAGAQRAGVDPPRVDSGHAIEIELGARRGVARRRAVPGLEVDELGATVALVHGVDATSHHAT